VLWHVGDLPGPIAAAGFFADCEVFLVRTGDTVQDWTYALPQRRLRGRDDLALLEGVPLLPHRCGAIQQPQLDARADGTVAFVYRDGTEQRACVLPQVRAETLLGEQFVALEQGMLIGVHLHDRRRYFVVRFADAACIATLEAPADLLLHVREQPGHLLLHSADGRLLDIDLRLSLPHALSLH
jgi:hypothetical protein